MGTQATITHVAQRAGVSIKTVSRVLNNEPNVTEALRERVMEAAKALDYSPRLSARRLAGSRSFLIGFLFDNPSPAYLAAMQRGAIARCRQDNYYLILEPVDMRAQDQRAIEGALTRLRPDGLILTPPLCDSPLVLDTAERLGVRYVCITPDRTPTNAPYIYFDETGAAYDMTRHLLALGHRRIGFIKGPLEYGATPRRLEGFLKAMREADAAVDWDLIRSGAFTFDSGLTCGQEMLSRPDRPTAILASNDDMALGVMVAAEQAGVSVPGELSIAGFDDSPASQLPWPPITTVRQNLEIMAHAAADTLIRLASKTPPQQRAIKADYELVIRESTAPPPT